jgi:TonB family protein
MNKGKTRKVTGLFLTGFVLFWLMQNNVSAQQSENLILEGTFWAGTNSDKDFYVIEFLQDGKLRYTSVTGTVSKGVWTKDRDSILIEMNGKFTKLNGRLSGNQLEGNAVSKRGHKWQWSATKQQAAVASQVAPKFPPLAGAAQISGKVRMEVQIDSTGAVASVRVLEAHPLLSAASEAAAKQWRFNPVTHNNSVRTVVITFSFRLTNKSEAKEKYAPKYLSAFQVEITRGIPTIEKEREVTGGETDF